MQDILSEADLSAGGLYRYFKSKEDIIIAIAERVLASIGASIETGFQPDDPLTADQVIGRLLHALEVMDNEQEIARLAVQVWAEAVRSPTVADHVRRAIFATMQVLVTRVCAYQTAGTIDASVPPELVARAILGIMPGFILQRAVLGDIDAATIQSAFTALMNPGSATSA